MTTVREFIESQLENYSIKKEHFQKIKTKVHRELNKMDEWYNLNDNDKKVVGKTTAYDRDSELCKKLEAVMEPYLLKLSPYSDNELKREGERLRRRAYNMVGPFLVNEDPDRKPFSIPKKDKLELMIEALFYDKFELDEELWNKDYSEVEIMKGETDEYVDSLKNASTGIKAQSARLQQPLKYYVKPKCKTGEATSSLLESQKK